MWPIILLVAGIIVILTAAVFTYKEEILCTIKGWRSENEDRPRSSTRKPYEEDDRHRRLIQRHRPFLVDRIDIMNTNLLDTLVAAGVLAQNQMEAVKQEGRSNQQRVSCLLDHMIRQPYDSWIIFLGALERSDNQRVAERIRQWTEGMSGRKNGPSFLFISQSPEMTDPSSDFILLQIKRTLQYISPNVNCLIRCKDDPPDMEEQNISHIFGILPNSSTALANRMAKEKSLIVTQVMDEVQNVSEVSRYINDSNAYFLGEEVHSSWRCFMDHSPKHETFIPAPIYVDSQLFVEPPASEISFIVDFVSAEPEQGILDLLKDAAKEMTCKDRICLKFIITPGSKECLETMLKQTKLAFDYSIEYFRTKDDAAKLFRNSIWLFLNKEREITWLRLQPLLHGIPQIISQKTKLYDMLRSVPSVIREEFEWNGTDAKGLAELLDKFINIPEAMYGFARPITEAFLCCPLVVESHVNFLRTCFSDNIDGLQKDIRRATEKVMQQGKDAPSLTQTLLSHNSKYKEEMGIPSDILQVLNEKGNWDVCQLLHKLIESRLCDSQTR